MMKLLSLCVGALLRPAVLVPALGLGLLVALHQLIEARERGVAAAARNVCNAEWERAIRSDEQSRAEEDKENLRRLLDTERHLNERLGHAKESLEREKASLLASSAAAGDRQPGCLSDGVLDNLRKRQERGPAKGRGAS